MEPPRKKLVLLLDGSWNSSRDNTNVWRLSQLIAKQDASGNPQLQYYTPGVGTPHGERILGGALGYGLGRDIVAAYRWLMGNFDRGDQIFLFGFSRGAFTARSLSGMIARCGLLRPGSPLSVEELYDRYRLDTDAPSLVELYQRANLCSDERRLLRHSRRVPIKMIGVWDTVGALGVPFGNIPGISRRRFGFHNTRLSSIFEHAYQALAIDEHRAAFAPTLWTRFVPTYPDPPGRRRVRSTTVEQRWFAGCHGNVGGGIPGDDMPQLPLVWMMEKAGTLGLGYRGAVNPTGHERYGTANDSFATFLCGTYRIAKLWRRHYRIIAAPSKPVGGGALLTVQETIDSSVFDRWRKYVSYRPANLIRWATMASVDPRSLRGPIDARTAKPLASPPDPRSKRTQYGRTNPNGEAKNAHSV
jgi:hypothetical protein